MKVIDNFINEDYNDQLFSTLTSSNFPWYYNPKTSYNSDKYISKKTLDTSQFCHIFFSGGVNSAYYEQFAYPILEILGNSYKENLLRFKANLLYRHPEYPEGCYHIPHVDSNDQQTETFLYYVNDSDGETFVFNEKPSDNPELTENKRISPKKNRGILFDSSYLHASSPPREHDLRIVLNFVFQK